MKWFGRIFSIAKNSLIDSHRVLYTGSLRELRKDVCSFCVKETCDFEGFCSSRFFNIVAFWDMVLELQSVISAWICSVFPHGCLQ